METTEMLVTAADYNQNATWMEPLLFGDDDDNDGALEVTFASISVVSLQAALMIFILAGNTLVIVAVWRYPSLQTVTNQFVVSLAVADLLVGLVLPYHASVYLLPSLNNQKYFCIGRFSSLFLPCCASFGNLLLISVDRFIAIMYPLRYLSVMTHQLATFLIVCDWVQATIQSSVPLYSNQWQEDADCLVTTVLWPACVLFAAFFNIGFVSVFMIVMYAKILHVALRQQSAIRQLAPTSRDAAATGSKTHKPALSSREVNTTKTLAIVIGTFQCCWGPFMVLVAIKSMGYTPWMYETLYGLFLVLGALNSGMNPVIYAWKNRQFRTAFNKILKRMEDHMAVTPFDSTGTSFHN